ncbi:MAG TPA: response regulator [Stellaceae bacterium]|nr:response regulator [Stellaceae bacterium]
MSQPGPAILVLEDDDQVRDTINAVLVEGGFDVTSAATAWEAVALIEEKSFDLVVADIRLPGGLDGLDMARHVRIRHPALRCLFISGQRAPVVCNPELDDFIAKPFRPHELLGCVWKVLRGNQPYPRIDIAR